ncbi:MULTISPECIES: CapA family protein [Clostridium]|uniref:CapA family protein n=1 Tax=Clostridium TaxID=1485 RepID=UPI002914F503|nr:CapA family protein [Clostridium sp.]
MNLLFLGDLFYDFDYIADDIYQIAEYIQKEKFNVILNLEGPITIENDNRIIKRGEHLCQNIKVLEVLSLLNVKGVTLSNNHMFDFLENGYEDTINWLDKYGIQHTGISKSSKDIPKGIVLEDGEECYEIFSGTDPFEESICRGDSIGCTMIEDLLNSDIQTVKGRKKIAFLHTGFEYNTIPTLRTVKECRNLIDQGFESVICSHPHLVQPYEVYNGKHIFYSIGNFYFSSFRKEFSNKEVANKSKNYCSLGYGVQIRNGQINAIGIEYDSATNTSLVVKNICLERLIKTNKITYIKQFYKNRNNHNFLLTGNTLFDSWKMMLLNQMYKIYRKVKHLE